MANSGNTLFDQACKKYYKKDKKKCQNDWSSKICNIIKLL